MSARKAVFHWVMFLFASSVTWSSESPHDNLTVCFRRTGDDAAATREQPELDALALHKGSRTQQTLQQGQVRPPSRHEILNRAANATITPTTTGSVIGGDGPPQPKGDNSERDPDPEPPENGEGQGGFQHWNAWMWVLLIGGLVLAATIVTVVVWYCCRLRKEQERTYSCVSIHVNLIR